jgi:hypothetical protein
MIPLLIKYSLADTSLHMHLHQCLHIHMHDAINKIEHGVIGAYAVAYSRAYA